MPSLSGYKGVRRHGHKWQAIDKNGVYGTYEDPYAAACALASAQGKPNPTRIPNAVEVARTVHEHVAALKTVLLAVPADKLMTVLGTALTEVEAERTKHISQPAELVQPALAGAPPQSEAPAPARLNANEKRRAKRVEAIAKWWRTLWETGQSFHLNIQRSRLFYHFDEAEKKRLAGGAREYDKLDSAEFVKLLKKLISKNDGEVSSRPAGGNSTIMWEIDPNKYCPEELKETWKAERAKRIQEYQEQQRLREKERAERAAEEQKLQEEEMKRRIEEAKVEAERWCLELEERHARVNRVSVSSDDDDDEDEYEDEEFSDYED